MKNKIFGFLLMTLIITACNKYDREKYPQLVSRAAYYQFVPSCYSLEFDNFDKLTAKMQNHINSYLKNRIGAKHFENLEFELGYVLSDLPIITEPVNSSSGILELLGQAASKSDCDTLLASPIYSVTFQFKNIDLGIESIGINLMMDEEGNVIKDVDFQSIKKSDRIIPIDSVHSELIRRKVPFEKLNIDLWLDKKTQSFYWAANTLIREGSILGPSCFPEIEYHFTLNANTGEILDYKDAEIDEFFVEH